MCFIKKNIMSMYQNNTILDIKEKIFKNLVLNIKKNHLSIL